MPILHGVLPVDNHKELFLQQQIIHGVTWLAAYSAFQVALLDKTRH